MSRTESYGELLRIGEPIITTREAATRLGTSVSVAGRTLRTLEQAGLVQRIRRGVWTLDPAIDPLVVAPYLTAPFPAYVSFWSALARHDMIEQIPRRISVASLDRARRIATTIASYEVHHLAPELFDGYTGSESSGYLAVPEKALFDAIYVRVAAGRRAYFPELSLPPQFEDARLDQWVERIDYARLRTIVKRRLREEIRKAERAPAASA